MSKTQNKKLPAKIEISMDCGVKEIDGHALIEGVKKLAEGLGIHKVTVNYITLISVGEKQKVAQKK